MSDNSFPSDVVFDEHAPMKTLRDEFAMAAIQMEHVQAYGAMTAADMAQRAYQIADAMLAARRG